MTYRSVSLKVCEGCGTLWIRGGSGTGVYCGPCTQILQQFPDPKTRLRPGRPTKQRVERSYGNAAEVAGGEPGQARLHLNEQESSAGEAISAQEDGLWESDEECGFAGNPAVLVGSSAVAAGGAA